ncbi:MAG TPA: right-handed parallel beta-helix repeat-containing protein [Sandaracinaceae bacterium LLY-WYZ-13_1]|nr:right-handed parallel beta-helix repeat-containing protein [Sandaracinaceae bacterium LLY-WYZ-13_1]
MRTDVGRAGARPALVALAAAMLGCAPETHVDLRLDAEPELAARARRIDLRILDADGELLFEQGRALGPGGDDLPVSLRLIAADDGGRFVVESWLRGPDATVLGHLEVQSDYLPRRAARLDLVFEAACRGVSCEPGKTCDEGRCVGACFEARPANEPARAASPISCVRAPAVYVDPGRGRDHPSACTDAETPCARLDYVLERYIVPGAGTVVNVRGGAVHHGPFTLRAAHSGAPAAPTVLRAWPEGSRPVLTGGGLGPALRLCCDQDAPRHVTVEGFRIARTLGTGVLVSGAGARSIVLRELELAPVGRPSTTPLSVGIQLEHGATDVRVEGCTVDAGDDETRIALSATDTERATFLDNRVRGEAELGVELLSGRRTRVEGNVIVDAYTGIEVRGDGHALLRNRLCDTRVAIDLALSTDVRVEHNTIVDGHRGANFGGRAVGSTFRSNLLAYLDNRPLSLPWSFERIELDESHNLYFETGRFFPDEFEPRNAIEGLDPGLREVERCELSLAPDSPARGAAHDGGNIGAR